VPPARPADIDTAAAANENEEVDNDGVKGSGDLMAAPV
jgi:hypothetical protein